MEKTGSVKVNVILNIIRQGINTLFPLITIPHVTRALNTDNYGMVSFSRAFVSYFILIAGLGISNYAVREGAKIRNNRDILSKFVSEIFSINFYMTIISYILLGIVLLLPQFEHYKSMILILSIEIAMNTFGVEWVCSVFEDFRYFTARTIVVRSLTLLAIFVLIKDCSDAIRYCWIIAGTYTLSNIANYFHSRKYIDFRLTTRLNIKKHLIPVLTMFGNTIMSTIYISSDKTILGLMSDDYAVGIYTLSTQAYSIIKAVINAMTIVTLARLSFFVGNNEREKYNDLFGKTLDSIVFIVCPAMVGMFLTSKEIIWVLGGTGYMEAVGCLRILSIALIFAVLNMLFTTEVLIPYGREKKVLTCSVISAVVNILINLFLIPYYNFYATAFTTFLAELIVLVMAIYYSKDLITYKVEKKASFEILMGLTTIVISCLFVERLQTKLIIGLVLKVVLSTFTYFATMIILRNRTILYFNSFIIMKVHDFITGGNR